ncbi:MAG: efflux RND transporter periplasmic adaptor subunit [Burkholderiales bacterium]|nr:efflux RND transporter periplasmic adaptor subunit [Burkholderiales bacterium]
MKDDLAALKIDRTRKPREFGRRRRLPRWLIVLLIAALAAIGAWTFFDANKAIEVEAAPVTMFYPSQAATVLNATGFVVAQRKAAVASKATGRLVWLNVVEGSIVKQNEVIARLEEADVGATLEQTRANVKLAEANLEQARAELKDAQSALARSRSLVKDGSVSRAENDTAEARFAKAKAAISSAQASIGVARANVRGAEVAVDQTQIRAPFDGVILSKHANVGDVVTPFSSALDAKGAVVTMADMDTLEVEADVSESNLEKVKPGQPAEIQLDALPGSRFQGEVHRIVPTVDRSKATVLAKIRFLERDPRILPEMSAKVAFLSERLPEPKRAPRTAVAASAIIERNGHPTAFVIDGEKVRAAVVETGEKLDSRTDSGSAAPDDSVGQLIEVRAGLKAGDKVVLRPPEELADGDKISIAEKQK